MKRYILAVAALFFVSFVSAQGVKTQLTPSSSAVFHSQPEKKEQGPVTQYTLVNKDSSILYTVAVVDLEATNGLTADVLAMAMADPSFWDQAEGGLMGSMGADAKKVKREIRKINGKEALYMEVERMEDGKKSLVSAMILIEGKNSINLVHRDRTAGDPNKDKFFASIEMAEAAKQ
jgi:hypothetical protein